MDVLIDNYQATPEEGVVVKKLIEALWDPNQHIITMFDNIRTHLQTLAEIKYAVLYPTEDLVKAVYMAIQSSK